MLRIPNPGSDIKSFINIYVELYNALHHRKDFGLDDISYVLVEHNLAASSGYVGAKALEESSRADRSRDPLYNQSKMYSELYKLLGWLHPTEEAALRFKFTFLGLHVVRAYPNPEQIFEQSLLGVVYPNPILDVKGNQHIRPFVTILKACRDLDGYISRDEMIIGPLSLSDDRNKEKYQEMISTIRGIRGKTEKLQSAINSLENSRRIKYNTMQNYTRFPIAVLKWTKWTVSQKMRIYERTSGFLKITQKGEETLNQLVNFKDIRSKDLTEFPTDELRAAVARLAFSQMLERANFDVSSNSEIISQDTLLIKSKIPGSALQFQFSPFQDMSQPQLTNIFPSVMGTHDQESTQTAGNNPNSVKSISSIVRLDRVDTTTNLYDGIKDLFISDSDGLSVDQIVERFYSSHSGSDLNSFYPFVEKLFRSLGYDCSLSRTGVNYERWDAIIKDPLHSIPIEIKSPSEEESISLKAIRQALENKIILLSREAYPTKQDTTSLVVGYNFPNNRSEAVALIEAFKFSYGFSIGIIDFRSLLTLVIEKILNKKQHNIEQMRTLIGFIDVKTT
nr:hypothetical protein [Anaerolineae bacterium]